MGVRPKVAAAADHEERPPIRAVAYVRVSLEREGMISPQLQLKAVSEYCALRDYKIIRVIEDLDLSGRFWKTRQVDQAIAMLERGEAEVLVVWRWSRVSRNRLDWAIALDRVEGAGGRLESASEGFDTTTATGRFARGMLAEFAAFESDRMADIWREVRDRRVSMGLTPFGHEQFGYLKRNGGYVIDKKTGPILHDLYRRYTEGESFKSLSAWLARKRVVAPNSNRTDTRMVGSTLIHMMDHGFAAGVVSLKGEQRTGAHTPIISPLEWAAYLARREQTRTVHSVKPSDSWLFDLIWCSCGHAMRLHARQENGRKARFVCRWHGGERRRDTRSINEDRLIGLVFQWLARLSTDARQAGTARADSARFARSSAEHARQLAVTISAGNGSPTTRQDMQEAEADAAWRDPVERARHLTEDWATLTDKMKREILLRIVDRVEVHTSHKAVTLTVHTRWKTTSILFCPDQMVQPCQLPAPGARWLKLPDAIVLARVNKATLRAWRSEGLLPLTRSDGAGNLLYALSDLQRVIAAPRSGNLGVNRAALRRDIIQLQEVKFRQPQHPNDRRLRELPDGVVADLQQARERELAAFGVYRRRVAIAETGLLILAASDAGWHDLEIGICMGLSYMTIYKRIRSARLRVENGGPRDAPVAPPSEPCRSTAFKETLAREREWLTVGEAAACAQRCLSTINHWRLAGLLPNTDEVTSTARLYLRSDLQRVLDGPRQLHGADYGRIRDLITEHALPTAPY